jgi:hypothetical protein
MRPSSSAIIAMIPIVNRFAFGISAATTSTPAFSRPSRKCASRAESIKLHNNHRRAICVACLGCIGQHRPPIVPLSRFDFDVLLDQRPFAAVQEIRDRLADVAWPRRADAAGELLAIAARPGDFSREIEPQLRGDRQALASAASGRTDRRSRGGSAIHMTCQAKRMCPVVRGPASWLTILSITDHLAISPTGGTSSLIERESDTRCRSGAPAHCCSVAMVQ